MTTNLYVSSYIGTITSLQLTRHPDASYSLTQVAVNDGSYPNPSWLTRDEHNGVVYCLDEGLTVLDGSLASYKTSASGVLTQIDRHSTINGPVSSVVYNGGKALAVAHYTGSAVTSWAILPSGGVQLLQEFPFTLSKPGPDPSRQEAPHPHQAVVDPTDSFIVVPDLGADLVRIFRIDHSTSLLTELVPFKASLGSGPRHGAFLASGDATYFFLVSELGNTVTSYRVLYGSDSLSFEELSSSGIYGDRKTPEGAAAAAALLTPDDKYLLTSSRNATLFQIPSFEPDSSTLIPSDTLQSWKIDHGTGRLEFHQLAPAGGRFPRQFSVNRDGTLAAVGLQHDGRVVIVQRDVENGTFGRFVAEIDVPGNVTCVIWDD
ncbi:hypothetical protein M430DRAFT_108136 [Amorphotheca resinae ATCC 22711]|uniref:3-carboxymuconate cyclase n=1 Tax=Amorphotheca resinae ATCC 22711 TaxID=857342 RepID=A0A2T3ATI9_AMORE|nr:hypothetical protein M430DRAFT_108136 [Amorphotheca resinae ATCC 22711]PSS10799.1 hypothetical protein M430DRAFT_108136 [Amorphotheca resinae ATCC 22711]